MRLWSGLLLASLLPLCSGLVCQTSMKHQVLDVECFADDYCYVTYDHQASKNKWRFGCATGKKCTSPLEQNRCNTVNSITTCCCNTEKQGDHTCNIMDFLEKHTIECKDESKAAKCSRVVSCYRETWVQGGRRIEKEHPTGCDYKGECQPYKLNKYNCTEPNTNNEQKCCCNKYYRHYPHDKERCNNDNPYFWMKCLDTQGEEEFCYYDRDKKPTTGACFVKRNADGFVLRGCEWEADLMCRDLEENECRGHGVETVCCCYEPNCNTDDLLPPIPDKCWAWDQQTATYCKNGTGYCYGRSWVQEGRREIDMQSGGSGCDTDNKFCAGKTNDQCTAIGETQPHIQTCCCTKRGCNQHPFFWLTCLDSNGEKEYCGFGDKEPTGNCYVTRSFSSEGNATGGCEWKTDKKEDMPCSNIGWNAAENSTFCHIDTKKNTKTCCCVESYCNPPEMVTTTTIATTAGQGKINGHQTMIVLALFTCLFLFN